MLWRGSCCMLRLDLLVQVMLHAALRKNRCCGHGLCWQAPEVRRQLVSACVRHPGLPQASQKHETRRFPIALMCKPTCASSHCALDASSWPAASLGAKRESTHFPEQPKMYKPVGAGFLQAKKRIAAKIFTVLDAGRRCASQNAHSTVGGEHQHHCIGIHNISQ